MRELFQNPADCNTKYNWVGGWVGVGGVARVEGEGEGIKAGGGHTM